MRRFLLSSFIIAGLGLGACALLTEALNAVNKACLFIRYADDSIVGTGFAAEGSLYTAKHVADAVGLVSEQVGPDLVKLGPSAIPGYKICRRSLVAGETLYIDLAPWPGLPAPRITSMFSGMQEMEGGQKLGSIFVGMQIWHGLSGSPVVTEQGEVVGAVVRLTEDPRWALFSPWDADKVKQ